MTISYAIGKNSTEGRTHTMCIEGTQGTEGRGWRDQGHSRPEGPLDELGQPGHMTGLQWTQPQSGLTLTPAISLSLPRSLQVVRTQNQASQSWWSWNTGCMQVTQSPKCCCSPSQVCPDVCPGPLLPADDVLPWPLPAQGTTVSPSCRGGTCPGAPSMLTRLTPAPPCNLRICSLLPHTRSLWSGFSADWALLWPCPPQQRPRSCFCFEL